MYRVRQIRQVRRIRPNPRFKDSRKSSSSLHIEKCDFTYQILSKLFYLVLFSCMNYHLTAKYKAGKLVAQETFLKF